MDINLFPFLLSNQTDTFGFWIYLVLALLVAVEGPIATLLGAVAASAGLMKPLFVFFAAALGNLTADTLWYLLGYMGKTEWIFHFGNRIGLKPGLIEHLKQQMISHATKVLFLAKLTVSFVIPSLITAGLLRIPWKRWFPSFIIAETLWTGSLVLIGYYTTEAVKRVEKGVEYAVLGLSLTFVVIVFLAGRRLLKQWDKDNPETPSH
ncbi:MAG TPA: VTT domain-containing protein [Anaerolineales bacterium]|nr:VTT domain-containing protein [Anaerolineales bacterium]